MNQMSHSTPTRKSARSEIITASPISTHRINSLNNSSKSLLKGAFENRIPTSSSETRTQQLKNYSPSKQKIERSFAISNVEDHPETMVVNDIIVGKQKCRFEISDGVSTPEIISFCCDMMFHALLGNRLEAVWQLYKRARDKEISDESCIKVCEDIVLSLYSFTEQEESLVIMKLAILQNLIPLITYDQIRFQTLEIIIQILKSNPITPNILLQCIKTSTTIGRFAAKELLRLCSSGAISSSRTEEILTVLANEERFQRFCIVPSLQEELLVTNDTTTKGTLAFALGMLKDRASSSLESVMTSLKNLNSTSSVSHQSEFLKALLVKALLNFGMEGTKGLLKLLRFADAKIVGRSATALGFAFTQESPSAILPIRIIAKFGNNFPSENQVPTAWIEPLSRVEDHSKPLPEPSTTDDMDKNKNQLESLWTLDYSKYVLVLNARAFMALLKSSLDHRDEWLNQSSPHQEENPTIEIQNNKEGKLLEEAVKELLECARNTSSYVRKSAVHSIGRIIREKLRMVPKLMIRDSIGILRSLALEDSSPDVREAVATATEYILLSKEKINGEFMEISGLLQAVSSDLLLKDPYWKVRNSAASACGKFGPTYAEQILPNLVKALVNGTVSRATVAASMAALGSEGASTLLYLLSQKTASYGLQVRVHAAEALGSIKFSEIRPSEIEYIADQLTKICVGKDEKPLVKSAGLKSLASLMKYKDAVPMLSPKGVVAFVYTFMKDNSKLVREAAAKIIASQKNGAFILMGAVTQDPSSVIRHTALLGLSHCGLAGLNAYIMALRDSDQLVRVSAQYLFLGISMESLCVELLHRSNQNRQEITEAIEQVLATERMTTKEIREKLVKLENNIKEMPPNVTYNFREYSAFKVTKQSGNGLVMAPVAPPGPPFSVE